MENFKHPYMARNPSHFWRRWHISFSTWIRDYLYIPLGGSRGTFAQMTKATFGAMLLSGLWHGASWTFVLWGAYHATLLTMYRLIGSKIPREIRYSKLGTAGAIGLMFIFTTIGWLIFRETNMVQLSKYSAESLFWYRERICIAYILLCVFMFDPLVTGLILTTYPSPCREKKLVSILTDNLLG